MIQKKICMLGAFAVGKTSLVSRYVHSIFSEKYLSTVGVKIDKKQVWVGGQDVSLILWDIYGEDAVQKVQTSYLRGAAGYLLIVDGTRRDTLDTALNLHSRAAAATGNAPCVLVLNKKDLVDDWDLDPDRIDQLRREGWSVLESSAKSGAGVEEAFSTLAMKMVPS